MLPSQSVSVPSEPQTAILKYRTSYIFPVALVLWFISFCTGLASITALHNTYYAGAVMWIYVLLYTFPIGVILPIWADASDKLWLPNYQLSGLPLSQRNISLIYDPGYIVEVKGYLSNDRHYS